MPLFSRRLLVTFEKSCDAGLRMRLFKRRPIVTIEDFCESFYDSEIFPSRSVSTWQYLLKFSLNRFNHDIVELDQSFSHVDMDALSREMVAIVMEVFGFQRLPILMFHLELGIRQLRFTESYLYQKDRKDIWETMKVYRKIIDDSFITDKHGNPFDASTRSGRRKINKWKEYRQYRYEKFTKKADKLKTHSKEEKQDEVYIQDALLRLGPNLERANRIAVRMIVDTLLDRIGLLDVINQDAKSRINFLVFDYFKETERYMLTYTSSHRIKI